jgi:hypothetical protein
MEVKITILGGKISKDDIPVTLPAVLGRSRDAGLTLGHPMISRKHAELFEKDGLLLIRDLGSLNGIKVGDNRVKEAALPPEGEFILGPFTFRVHYEYSGDLSALPPPVLDDKPAEQAAGDAKAWAEASPAKPATDAMFDLAPGQEGPVEQKPAAKKDDVDDDFFNDLFSEG